MLPCCFFLDEVTVQGFACSLPLVPDSQFQQERNFIDPFLCCLHKDLLHGIFSGIGRRSLILTPTTSK